jgi:hypothetical protein
MADSITKNDDGTYPAFAWPGGYPIYYLAADNGCFCPDCANGKNGSLCQFPTLDPECPDDRQWRIVGQDVHWEGEPIICDNCGAAIESAYGIPE